MQEDLKTKVKTEQADIQTTSWDIIVIGAGIAGLTCALYAARSERRVLVIESQIPGGRITTTDVVENWPTHLKISGIELGEILNKQVTQFGVKIEWGIATTIKRLDKEFIITLEGGKLLHARSIVIATGVNPRKLGVPGEKEFRGRGVSYCATCDGAFYKNKEVVVVGGGDSAVKEALFLTKFAKRVTIIHRRDKFRAERIISRQAQENPKINILWNTVVEEILGEGNILTGLKLKSTSDHALTTLFCDGVFLYVGNHPNTEVISGLVKFTESGYVAAGEDTRTNVPGIFAAGDIREKELRQLVTAASDGAVAAVMADQYLDNL